MRKLRAFSRFVALALFVSSPVMSRAADSTNPKPEEALHKMADYLGKIPAFSCKVDAVLTIKTDDENIRDESKMTVRLERPNRLVLNLDEGKLGLTVYCDGKKLVQYLPILKRYAITDAPKEFAEMTDVGVPLKPTILGSTGVVIPTGNAQYFKTLMEGVTGSKYFGIEKIGATSCDHLRFTQESVTWDVWIAAGSQPVIEQLVLDLSKEVGDEPNTAKYTVRFTDWNVAPKFKDSDFEFKKPAGADEVDELIGPEPPHPLVGKAAPEFKTTDLNGHPFELKKYLGKNVILLDFWATWCGPCMMAMPKVDAVAEKFADKGLIFRAVNGGEDADTIKSFLKHSNLKPPVVLDQDNSIAQDYQVDGIPQLVLIGKDGKVQVVHQGYSEELPEMLTKEIDSLLAGKDLVGEAANKSKKKKPVRDASTDAEKPAKDTAK
jgi:peroxiredoxin